MATPEGRRPERPQETSAVPGPSLDWRKFVSLTEDQPPWPRVVGAAGRFSRPGDALDVGAGGGRDTRFLLSHDWRVTAVDGSPYSAAPMRKMPRIRWLRFVEMPIQEFQLETYDLVSAQFSLPFIPAHHFRPTVMRLARAVRPAGVLTATFFGPNDEWNAPGSALTFTARDELAELVRPLVVDSVEEENRDGQTADGTPKHWHVFHVLALGAC